MQEIGFVVQTEIERVVVKEVFFSLAVFALLLTAASGYALDFVHFDLTVEWIVHHFSLNFVCLNLSPPRAEIKLELFFVVLCLQLASSAIVISRRTQRKRQRVLIERASIVRGASR